MGFPKPGAAHPLRKYPVVKVGDTFGMRTVTAIVPRDSTSNERVEWRCACGRWGTSYVFNLRRSPKCTHGARTSEAKK